MMHPTKVKELCNWMRKAFTLFHIYQIQYRINHWPAPCIIKFAEQSSSSEMLMLLRGKHWAKRQKSDRDTHTERELCDLRNDVSVFLRKLFLWARCSSWESALRVWRNFLASLPWRWENKTFWGITLRLSRMHAFSLPLIACVDVKNGFLEQTS